MIMSQTYEDSSRSAPGSVASGFIPDYGARSEAADSLVPIGTTSIHGLFFACFMKYDENHMFG